MVQIEGPNSEYIKYDFVRGATWEEVKNILRSKGSFSHQNIKITDSALNSISEKDLTEIVRDTVAKDGITITTLKNRMNLFFSAYSIEVESKGSEIGDVGIFVGASGYCIIPPGIWLFEGDTTAIKARTGSSIVGLTPYKHLGDAGFVDYKDQKLLIDIPNDNTRSQFEVFL